MISKQDLKDTEIGSIPKEWEVVRLGDKNIVDLIMGQSPPSSTYNDKKLGLPFLQGNAEFGEIYPKPILTCSQPIKVSEKNDILLSVSAPVGDVNITPYKLCIGRGLAAIRPKSDKLYYLFLFYHLKSGSRIFESLSMGSTFKAIRKEEVEKYQLPLPPLPEQQKIAEILSTADEAIQKVDEAIEKTERFKKGLMQILLRKGIKNSRFKIEDGRYFKDTEIGRIPKEWEVQRVADLFIVETGLTPSTKQNNFWNNGTINWITPSDLSKLNGKIEIRSSKRRITEKALKETNLTLMPIGSIILSTRAPVGYVAVIQEKAAFNQGCKGLIIKERKDTFSKYYCYYLLNKKQELQNLSSGSTFKELSKDKLKNFKLPLPPLPEQQKIAEILSTVDKRLELLREKKKRFERIKRGLMNELLTGKRRVKVNEALNPKSEILNKHKRSK